MKLPFLILTVASVAHAADLVITSPPPERAEARRVVFENRLAPDSPFLKETADRFFSYLHPRITLEMAGGDAALQQTFQRAIDLHAQGQSLAALEAYRDGFMDRLAAPAGRLFQEPRKLMPNVAREEVLERAGRWLSDPVVFQNPVVAEPLPPGADWQAFVKANRDRVERLNLVLGTPGTLNWTWTPTNVTPVNAWYPERWLEYHLGDVLFGSVLLRAYEETGEAKYLARYADLLDDRDMFWLGDVLASGRGLYIGVNDSEGYAGEIGLEASLLGALRHLAIHRPESRRAFPPLTLALALLRMYEVYLPVQMRLVRCITGNRLSHMYSHRLGTIGLSFPEFVFSDYLVREKRRSFEVYPVASGYPDGHDVNWAYNYAFNYPSQNTIEMMQADPAKARYHTPEWVQFHRDHMVRRIRTLAHSLFINGTAPRWAKPDQDYGVRWRKIGIRQADDKMPDWLAQHDDILRITSTVYGNGWAGSPYATSEAFPFTGFYHLRTGWNPQQDIDAFFSPYRPFHYHGPSVWGHVKLFAFGRTFIDHRYGGELSVDGAPKVESQSSHLLPASYFTNWRVPPYGPPQWHMGDDVVLPYRFHTSPVFDFAEGVYTAPFIDAERKQVIEDTRQARSVALAKQAGLLVVADHLQSATNRLYTLQWGLHASVNAADLHVDEAAGAIHTRSEGQANVSLYQVSSVPGIYGGAQASGEALQRLEEINWRGRFGQDIKTQNLVFHYGPAADAHVLTVLHTRKPGEPPLARFTPVRTETEIGFDAETASGQRVAIRRPLANPKAALSLTTGENRLLIGGAQGDVLEMADPEGVSQFPIHRPLELVHIDAEATTFADTLAVTLSHSQTNVSIVYTTDGSDPTIESPRYTGPITLDATTLLKAVAVRADYRGHIGWQADSTDYSITASALFTKRAPMEAVSAPPALAPGLRYALFEGDIRLTGLTFPFAGKLAQTGIVDRLVAVPVKPADATMNYGLRYSGYLRVPTGGLYTIWAPDEFMHWAVDTACDLKVRINGELWEPATQRTGFRGWSIPLEAGLHRIEVDFIDMRPGDMRPGETTGRVYWYADETTRIGDRLMWEHRIWDGEAPALDISGPGLTRQAIPSDWLLH